MHHIFFLALAIGALTPLSAYAVPPEKIRFIVKDFQVEGAMPISPNDANLLLSRFKGKEYGINDLLDVSLQLERLIRDSGFAFYRVILPPQDVNNGQITLKVIPIALGSIEIKGNKYFDEENIIASVPELKLADSPNTVYLTNQIKVANNHPNKEINVVFKQGDLADEVVAKVDIIDSDPSQYSLSINNSGSDDTGNMRVTGGYQYSNLWNKDHRINLNYTTSPNHTRDVRQYGFNYAIPFYKYNSWLSSYYAKSDVDTGQLSLGESTLDVSGTGEMFGFHYTTTLHNIEAYNHQFDIGFDNRFFNNTVLFSAVGFNAVDIAPEVRSTPLTFTYSGSTKWNGFTLGHNLSWSKNMKVGSRNDDVAYLESRSDAKASWDLIRYGAFAVLNSGNWQFRANLNGQYSNEPLISGEQFGIGGSSSVRGYNEREAGSDIGQNLTLEAYAPAWHGLNLLAFYDYGQGRSHNIVTAADIKDQWHLASIGLGLRWLWQGKVQTSLDWGHTLRQGVATSDNHNHIHASVSLQF